MPVIPRLPLLLALLPSACATLPPPRPAPLPDSTTGQVDAAVLEAPAADRYAATDGVSYEQPVAFPDNALPAYPPPLLAQRLPPQRVSVRVVVDAAGQVAGVSRLDTAGEDPASEDPAFFLAVSAAVRQWRFFPLVEIRKGEPASLSVGEVTTRYPGQPRALPFHQDYVFRFVQHDGRPAVELD